MQGSVIHHPFRVFGVLLGMVFSSYVARADYVLTGQPSLRIQEGQIGLLSIQAANTSSFAIQVDEFGVDSVFLSGDSSDGITLICCGPSPLPVINPGQTLTYFVNIGTTIPPPDDNYDSGFWGLTILGDAHPVGNLVGFVPVHSTGSVVEVYDAVPEPSSLLLFFSGVAGLPLLLRRRLRVIMASASSISRAADEAVTRVPRLC